MYWYEDDVKHLEAGCPENPELIDTVFYGSSSIRLWTNLAEDFPSFHAVNLGFGGSTLAACVWFFERIFKPYNPKRIIIYAGDNDLGDGRHPEEVLIFFQQLAYKINQKFGEIPVYFLSLKPSLSRWHLSGQFTYTNRLIQNEIEHLHPGFTYLDLFSAMLTPDGVPNHQYFTEDGLHLSEQGYALWKNILTAALIH